MIRKAAILMIAFWLIALLGGGLWGLMEHALAMRSIPPGAREVRTVQDLYGAHLFDEAIKQCDRAEHDPKDADFLPRILYIHWAASRRLARTSETERVQREFLRRFPNNPLAADMHFADAMQSLAQGDYATADKQLAVIEQRFPNAPVTSKARDIRQRLIQAMPAATRPALSAERSNHKGGCAMTTGAVPSSPIEIAPTAGDHRSIATRAVMLLASLLLFFAAAMKWRQLPVVERLGDDLLHRQSFVGGQIVFEASLAAWLLSGTAAKWSRRVALAAFGVFACVALYEAVGGAESCGCFGQFKVNPWITVIVDLLFAGTLARSPWWHGLKTRPMNGRRFGIFGACLIAIIGLTVWRYNQSLAVDKGGNDGILFTQDGLAILDTDNWVGKPLPIASYLNATSPSSKIAVTGYQTGNVVIMIYSNECDHCRRAVPRYVAWLKDNSKTTPFWFVEMPPYAKADEALVSPALGINCLRLSDQHEWFAQTPVLVKLENGIVTQVVEGDAAADPNVFSPSVRRS